MFSKRRRQPLQEGRQHHIFAKIPKKEKNETDKNLVQNAWCLHLDPLVIISNIATVILFI